MNDGGKVQALSLSEVKERLLNKRHDAVMTRICAYPPCKRVFTPEDARQKHCCPDHAAKAYALKHKPPLEPRICEYEKCRRSFTPTRADQKCCCADHRKRKWFDAHFMPIPKPGQP